jgi:2-iminobutanoate/2-iminopropanoate deaminase
MRVLKTALLVSLFGVGLSAQTQKQYVPPAPGDVHSQAVSVGGFVYVSGMMAADVKGEIGAQTTQIFENLRSVLKQAGSSVDNIVNAIITVEQAGDLPEMDKVYGAQFKGDPPARTVYIGNMVRPGALIEIAVTAVPTGAARRAILPDGWMKPPTWSWAIEAGDTVFLSGMVSADMKDYTPVRGDVPQQVRKAMDNALVLLKTAGLTLDNTVSARNVITHRVADFFLMNTAYAPYWTVKDWKASGPGVPGRPGRATVGLENPPGFDFQTTLIAVKSGTPREIVVAPNADGTPGEQGPWYPSGVTVGNRMWVSGTTGGNVQPIKAHIQNNINSLVRFMKASNFDLSHVVAVEVWLTNVRHLDVLNEVFRENFPKNPPVRKVVGVDSLGGTSMSEIAFIAVR